MQTPMTTPASRFPILVQAREREAWDAPTDIWQRTYVQGATVDDDQLEGPWTKVAARRRINEHGPCFTGPGEPAYVRSDRLRPGLYAKAPDAKDQVVVPGPLEQACFSRDGQLAYVREGELWLADADGSPARQLTTACVEGPVDDLEFSADGRQLWYCAGTNLFRHDPAAVRHECVSTRHLVSEFSLAPDGRAVAYLDDRNGLYRLDLDKPFAERETQLAQVPLTDPLSGAVAINNAASPAFTPDGSRVLFCVHVERWDGPDWEDEGPTQASLWAVPARGGEDATRITYDEDVSRVAVPRTISQRLAA